MALAARSWKPVASSLQIRQRGQRAHALDVRIVQPGQHLREAVGGGGVVLLVERGLGRDVALLHDARQEPAARIGERRAQARRQVVGGRAIERVLRDHALDDPAGFAGVADGDETERAIQVDRQTIRGGRILRQQPVEHVERTAVLGRRVQRARRGERRRRCRMPAPRPPRRRPAARLRQARFSVRSFRPHVHADPCRARQWSRWPWCGARRDPDDGRRFRACRSARRRCRSAFRRRARRRSTPRPTAARSPPCCPSASPASPRRPVRAPRPPCAWSDSPAPR